MHFVLVNIEPDAGPDDDAWFVIPGTRHAMVAPLGSGARFLEILDQAAGDLKQPRCSCCDEPMPTQFARDLPPTQL